jgi:hypothetical protein
MGTVAIAAEPIKCSKEITNVLSTFFFFDTVEEMIEKWNEQNPDDQEDPNDPELMMGYSYCERKEDMNIAYCDVYQVRPTVVDGDHTLTLGHEVFHGVCGTEYHD